MVAGHPAPEQAYELPIAALRHSFTTVKNTGNFGDERVSSARRTQREASTLPVCLTVLEGLTNVRLPAEVVWGDGSKQRISCDSPVNDARGFADYSGTATR